MDIDDDDPQVQYASGSTYWEAELKQRINEVGNTVHIAHTSSASLSLQFSGTGVAVVGFINIINGDDFQDLLTCTVDGGEPVVPHLPLTNAGQQVTFCSITSLPNQQHTLVVEIGSNGVNNVELDNFHITNDGISTSSTRPPNLPVISASNPVQSSQNPSHYVPTPTSPVSLDNPAFQTPSDSVTPSPSPPPEEARSLSLPSSTDIPVYHDTLSTTSSESATSRDHFHPSLSVSFQSSTASSQVLATPPASDAPLSSSFSHRTKTRVIVGGVVGGIIMFLILLAAFACFRRRQHAMNRQNSTQDEMSTINDPEPLLKTWNPDAFYSHSHSHPTTPIPVALDETFTRPFSLSSSTHTVFPDGQFTHVHR